MDKLIYTGLESFLKDRHMSQRLDAEYPTQETTPIAEPEFMEKIYQLLLSGEKIETPNSGAPTRSNPYISEEKLRMIMDDVNSDRDYIQRERRQLKNTCKKYAIDITLFKGTAAKSNKYCITKEVATLFSFILNSFAEKRKEYKVVIKKPSNELLIHLRKQILSALSSLDKDDSVIRHQLEAFEEKTGCPAKSYYIAYSALTEETIEYMKQDVSLSDEEWTKFADILEYDYRYKWRAQFIKYSQKRLQKFLEEIGKSDLYPDERDSIRKFLLHSAEKE